MRMHAAVLLVRTFCLIPFFLFVFSSPIQCQPRSEIPPIEFNQKNAALIERSQQALLDFRLNRAEQLLRKVISVNLESPYGYYLYSSVAFWRAMVDGVEPAYDQFYERSDSLFDRLAEVDDTRWNRFMSAEAYLQRAIVLGKTEHFLRAAWTGRKVYNGYNSLVTDYPDFYAAYLGMGLTHVLLGSLPGTYRWILARLGISGTVDEGLEELELAAEKSKYNASQAQATLALIDLILNQERPAGVKRLEALYRAHPESLMFAHLYGFSLFLSRRADAAEKVFRKAQQKRENPAYHYVDFVTFYLGEVLFVRNKFQQAERQYRDFLENYEGEALRAVARLRCGLALEMQDDYQQAQEFYEQVNTDRTFDSDEFARRTAEKRLERPMTKTERQLLAGSNYYEAGAYDSALELLRPLHRQADNSPDERAEAAFYLGRVHHAKKQFEEAFTYYGFAAKNPGDESEKWQPWSQFYIGTIYAERGETGKARALFEQVLRYEHDYSYKNALEQRVHTALDQL